MSKSVLRNLDKPFPDGFAVTALTLGMHQLRLHYGVHSDLVSCWLRRMPEAWRIERKANMQANRNAASVKRKATFKVKALRLVAPAINVNAAPMSWRSANAAKVGSERLRVAIEAMLTRRAVGLAA